MENFTINTVFFMLLFVLPSIIFHSIVVLEKFFFFFNKKENIVEQFLYFLLPGVSIATLYNFFLYYITHKQYLFSDINLSNTLITILEEKNLSNEINNIFLFILLLQVFTVVISSLFRFSLFFILKKKNMLDWRKVFINKNLFKQIPDDEVLYTLIFTINSVEIKGRLKELIYDNEGLKYFLVIDSEEHSILVKESNIEKIKIIESNVIKEVNEKKYFYIVYIIQFFLIPILISPFLIEYDFMKELSPFLRVILLMFQACMLMTIISLNGTPGLSTISKPFFTDQGSAFKQWLSLSIALLFVYMFNSFISDNLAICFVVFIVILIVVYLITNYIINKYFSNFFCLDFKLYKGIK